MTVVGVNGAQSPEFVQMVNQPQAAYANSPQLTMSGQPQVDSYEGPRQEEKKGSFLGSLFKTLIVAGALIGLNRYAHSSKLIEKIGVKNPEGFVAKYIRKPLGQVDEYVVKNYEKYIAKGTAKTEPEAPSA
jgi:hypothetical protein